VLLPALQEVNGSQFSFFIGSTANGQLAKSSSVVIPTATNASNLIGGTGGVVPYQSGVNITGFSAVGTSGQVLTSGGSGVPTWTSQSALSVGSAATLTTARTIGLSGDVTGTATSFNGSANITIPVGINNGSIVPAYLSTGGPTWDTSGNINALGTITGFGITNGSSAAAGVVGQYVASQVTTGVAMTASVTTNITSITLTAGDWDVTGDVYFTVTTTASTMYQLACGSNTISATFGAQDTYSLFQLAALLSASSSQCFVIPTVRFSLTAASTTIYLVAQVSVGSSITGKGTIRARRIR
jgi:hypothetical protein